MKKQEAVVVLSIHPKNTQRLLAAGREMAERRGRPLRVLSILPQGDLCQPDFSRRIDSLTESALAEGADITVLFSDQPASAAGYFLSQENIGFVVAGKPSKKAESRFLKKLRAACPQLPIYIIEPDADLIGDPLIDFTLHPAINN